MNFRWFSTQGPQQTSKGATKLLEFTLSKSLIHSLWIILDLAPQQPPPPPTTTAVYIKEQLLKSLVIKIIRIILIYWLS